MPAKHVEQVGDSTHKLGQFVTVRHVDYRQEELSPERIDALEALPGWVWDGKEAEYQDSFSALVQFADREGHVRVPTRHVEIFDGREVNLGSWRGSRKAEFRRGTLSQERIDALEALPGWEW